MEFESQRGLPRSVGSVSIQNNVGVWVVLQTLTHFLPVSEITLVRSKNSDKNTYAAKTKPVTIKFCHGALSNR
jgi:hypothetical protein